MAAMSFQKLKQIIADAYAAGYSGSLDLKEAYVDETIQEILSADQPATKNEGWRVFKINELRTIPVGTIYDHESLGKGWTENNGTETYMRFHTGEIYHFYTNENPWDQPMRIVGTTMKNAKPRGAARV